MIANTKSHYAYAASCSIVAGVDMAVFICKVVCMVVKSAHSLAFIPDTSSTKAMVG